MAFYCKPSGRYTRSGTEWTNNVQQYYAYMSNYSTLNNIVGQLCNVEAESGMNPWRWQGDTYGSSRGYGLYQYTPASSYINLSGIPGHAPNLSTSSISGGNESDASAQMYVFVNNSLNKWHSSCWRSYWDSSVYTTQYAKRTYILNTYGDGSNLSLAQFLTIDNYEDSCFAFLACFEGPLVPNYTARLSYAQAIYDALGSVPPTPPPPTPPTPGSGDYRLVIGKFRHKRKNAVSRFKYKR